MALIGVSACASAVDETATPGLLLQTNLWHYQAVGDPIPSGYRQWHFQVIATLTNNTPAPVYVERCNAGAHSPVFSVGIDGSGESAYDPIWACGGLDHQLLLAPHARRVDTLQVSGPNEFGVATPGLLTSGTFRLAYYVSTCDGNDCVGTVTRPGADFEVTALP
jgi:hypothetical protein